MIQHEKVLQPSDVYICDHCKKYLGSVASSIWKMITYSYERMDSGQGFKMTHHFCGDTCLLNFMKKRGLQEEPARE